METPNEIEDDQMDIVSILKGALHCKSCVINAMGYIQQTLGIDKTKPKHKLVAQVIAKSMEDLSNLETTRFTFDELRCVVAQRLERLEIRQSVPIETIECHAHKNQRHGSPVTRERLIYVSTPGAAIPLDYKGFDVRWQMFPG